MKNSIILLVLILSTAINLPTSWMNLAAKNTLSEPITNPPSELLANGPISIQATTLDKNVTYKPVLFQEGIATGGTYGGISQLPSTDAEFKPLPSSFNVSREWQNRSIGYSYIDHEREYITNLNGGTIINFCFNSSAPISLTADRLKVAIDDVYSAQRTMIVPETGWVTFLFGVGDSVHKSENAVVSFSCNEVVQNTSSVKPYDNKTNAETFNTTSEIPANLATPFASSVGTLPDSANPHPEPPTETIMLTLLVVSVILLVLVISLILLVLGRNVASAGREE